MMYEFFQIRRPPQRKRDYSWTPLSGKNVKGGSLQEPECLPSIHPQKGESSLIIKSPSINQVDFFSSSCTVEALINDPS